MVNIKIKPNPTLSFLLIVMTIAGHSLLAQDNALKTGFSLLEKKEFSKAATYFDSLSVLHANDFTIALLRARSSGLDGQFEKASDIMDSLLSENPDQLDLRISRAELYLWQKKPEPAIPLLQELYKDHSANRSVLFTYCNALIAGQKFETAFPVLEAVRSATAAAYPWPDMMKNLRIGYALSLRSDENYAAATRQLDTILQTIPGDPPTLLLKGDLLLQDRQYGAAASVYPKILPSGFEKTNVLINLSYALFMQHRPAKALKKAEEARLSSAPPSKMAMINNFNALLWNLKTSDAARFLNRNLQEFTTAELLLLQARLYTSSGDFKSGLLYYDSLIIIQPDKNYIREYADVLIGKKEPALANRLMKANDSLFTESEKKAWDQQLDNLQVQHAGTELVYFSDIGKNIRTEVSVFWSQSALKKYALFLKAGTVNVSQSLSGEKTAVHYFYGSLNERFNRYWSGQTELNIQQIRPSASRSAFSLIGKQMIRYQPTDRLMTALYYSSELFNFTASLLEKNIRSHNIGYLFNRMLTGRTGIYSQGSKSFLTDKNQRSQVFISLYNLLRTEPTLKAGLNFSALHYADSSVKLYFAPNRYLTGEIFADYSTAMPLISNFYFQAQAAAGLQQIEIRKAEPTLRVQFESGYRKKRIEASLKYQTSNVASANGAGYKFNWFTFRFLYKWK